jgi:hypothetical protein
MDSEVQTETYGVHCDICSHLFTVRALDDLDASQVLIEGGWTASTTDHRQGTYIRVLWVCPECHEEFTKDKEEENE